MQPRSPWFLFLLHKLRPKDKRWGICFWRNPSGQTPCGCQRSRAPGNGSGAASGVKWDQPRDEPILYLMVLNTKALTG